MVFHGKWYDEVEVGDSFGTSLTVTETHIVLGSGMFGDFNPLHVDEEFSKKSLFGGRVLHGPFTSAMISSPVGMYFAGTAIAYLEHSCRFKVPVRAGDTITTNYGHRQGRQAEAQGRRDRDDRGGKQSTRRSRGQSRRKDSGRKQA
ncbi:MAG TPA: MaoC/PaaZ C-terminal domain-containing protein [Burkholderiales bacterium]|nr:MaoC/PaaZ C-terminal domain-containing protein [Burkholderiales bacterium]